jgi:hypothetical protein
VSPTLTVICGELMHAYRRLSTRREGYFLARNKQTRIPEAWTLFGPYEPHRKGPRGNGPSRQINKLAHHGPLQKSPNPVEVLAGAISWGFKSPSPHHILNGLADLALTLFS